MYNGDLRGIQKLFFVLVVILAALLMDPLFVFADGRILIVGAEQKTYHQTGGLADVLRGAANSFNKLGIRADVVMPRYEIMDLADIMRPRMTIDIPLNFVNGISTSTTQYLVKESKEHHGGSTFLFRHIPMQGPMFFANSGGPEFWPYGPKSLQGLAFGSFALAVTKFIVAQKYDKNDVIILNDWHSGLIALFLNVLKNQGLEVPKVVFTIHNMAFQGIFDRSLMSTLGIPDHYFHMDGIEYYGNINFMKAGIAYSDVIIPVSPQYEQEILTARFGAGLDGLLRAHSYKLYGVLNGIDAEEWNPAIQSKFKSVKYLFDAANLVPKAKGKALVQEKFGLPINAKTPLFVLTSRLAEQKGFEYLSSAIDQTLANHDAQFIISGNGERKYKEKLIELQAKYPDKLKVLPFSHETERLLIAYGDVFINAPWFEPSGVNQMFALLNGTPSILAKVGGLVNSIVDDVTGWFFEVVEADERHSHRYHIEPTIDSLVKTINRSIDVYRNNPNKFLAMQKAGMAINNSWDPRVAEIIVPELNRRLGLKLTTHLPKSCQARAYNND